MNKILLVSVQDVIDNSYIEKTVGEKLIRNTILSVQTTRLEPIITDKLYEKILKGYEDVSLTGVYKELLFDKIRPFLYSAVEYYIADPLRYKIQVLGISKEKSENSETISFQEHENMKKGKQSTMEHYSIKLIEYLEANKSELQEYEAGGDDSEQGLDIGIYLGD